jgi:hypothetical protein
VVNFETGGNTPNASAVRKNIFFGFFARDGFAIFLI